MENGWFYTAVLSNENYNQNVATRRLKAYVRRSIWDGRSNVVYTDMYSPTYLQRLKN